MRKSPPAPLQALLTDQRSAPRVAIAARVRTVGPSETAGKLRDISVTGACVLSQIPLGSVGETLVLCIERDGHAVEVMGDVVRATLAGDCALTAIRFTLVDPSTPIAIFSLVHEALAEQSGTRRHARIATRVPMAYGEAQDRVATLVDLSYGGLAMETVHPFPAGEAVEMHLPDVDGQILFSITGRVTSCRPTEQGRRSTFRVGVRLDSLDPEAILMLDVLLRRLLRGTRPGMTTRAMRSAGYRIHRAH